MPPEQVVMSRDDLMHALRTAASATPSDKRASLSTEEMEQIARQGVKRAFTEMGIDCKNPIEMQKDFAFIRSIRKSVNQVKTQGLLAAIGVIVVSVLGLVWLGFKMALKEH